MIRVIRCWVRMQIHPLVITLHAAGWKVTVHMVGTGPTIIRMGMGFRK
jgi:hypothetical protein